MNCPTHIQDVVQDVLEAYLNKYTKPPIYLYSKIRSHLLEALLDLMYKKVPKSLMSYMPSNTSNFLRNSELHQIRILRVLLTSLQASKFKSLFKGNLNLYLSADDMTFTPEYLKSWFKVNNSEKYIDTDKLLSKQLHQLFLILLFCHENASRRSHAIIHGQTLIRLTPLKPDGNYRELKSIDFLGLKLYKSTGQWQVRVFDQQLLSQLSVYRIAADLKPIAVNSWQNLPVEVIKRKYKLVENQILRSYVSIPKKDRLKINKKIKYFLGISYLYTVSKKCKISTCRAKDYR